MKRIAIFICLSLVTFHVWAQSDRREDRAKRWSYGPYEIRLDGYVSLGLHGYKTDYEKERTVSIYDKASGKYVIPPIGKAQAKAKELPAGTYSITMKTEALGYDGWDRIYFFNSALDGTPKELDGMLYIQGKRWRERYHKKGAYAWPFIGIFRIENDELVPVVFSNASDNIMDPKLVNNGGWSVAPLQGTSYIRLTTPVRRDTIIAGDRRVIQSSAAKLFSYEGECKLDKKTNIWVDGGIVWGRYGGDTYEELARQKDIDYWYLLDTKAYDLQLHPILTDYDYRTPWNIKDFGIAVIVGKNGQYGLIDTRGNVLRPLTWPDPSVVVMLLENYSQASYTCWYNLKTAKLRAEQGEFEKTEHFQARQADPDLQEAYLKELIPQPEQAFLEETRSRVKLLLEKYNPDTETFPIGLSSAPWNTISLHVPVAEAPAFKSAFKDIQAEALQGADLAVEYDMAVIRQITFNLPDGKKYNFTR